MNGVRHLIDEVAHGGQRHLDAHVRFLVELLNAPFGLGDDLVGEDAVGGRRAIEQWNNGVLDERAAF